MSAHVAVKENGLFEMEQQISQKTDEPARERVPAQPSWWGEYLGVTLPGEGEEFLLAGMPYVMRNGIARSQNLLSWSQSQTQKAFGFIWSGDDRFQSSSSLDMLKEWYITNYGDIAGAAWWSDYGASPIVVDVGCGAGISAIGLFADRLRLVRYVGVDVSGAVDFARRRFADRGLEAAFIQTSLMNLPFPEESVDLIYAQGVLHHTDSTQEAISAIAKKLKRGGRLLCYVYRKKGPIREFTDDYVRSKLQSLSPEEMWEAMLPLTKFGVYLGDLKIDIEVPEAIPLLDIPAGRISLQRFIYWHVFKAFYSTNMTLEECNHINVDWYGPVNAHRQTPEQVRSWCSAAGLVIEREHVQESGISVVARKL